MHSIIQMLKRIRIIRIGMIVKDLLCAPLQFTSYLFTLLLQYTFYVHSLFYCHSTCKVALLGK